MDKNKLKPYQSEEELYKNAENIDKEWKREEYKDYIFSARHMVDDPEHPENCLHLYLDEDRRIRAANWVEWARYMNEHEKLRPWELKIYEGRLYNEFMLWMRMESKRLVELEKRRLEEAERQAKLTALFLSETIFKKSKYTN